VDLWQYLDVLVLAVIGLAVAPLAGYAFVHALRQRSDAFTAVGKQTKGAWLGITGGSAFFLLLIPVFSTLANPTWFGLLRSFQGIRGFASLFWLAGLVATLVYLVDVKPAVVRVQGGGHNW
jgi:hypothetical protein